ncbi:hypothetical protein KDL29_01505 [bacterium]|nr:hypothetical protein [bacterium]
MKKRKSPRFPGFDYSTPGAYHISISTKDRVRWLAFNAEDGLALTEIGIAVANSWRSLEQATPNAVPDYFAVMPDHFHGIVQINLPYLPGFDPGIRADLRNVMRCFKQYTQHLARKLLMDRGEWQEGTRIWQSSFYDNMIRDEKHLYLARKYVLENELAWRLERKRKLNMK